ncbi:MAG: alkaline phosphatase family protein [Actinomycetota bacterium]
MLKRVAIIAVLAAVIAGGALYALRPAEGVPEGAPTEDEMASEIGAPIMEHVKRGHVVGASGEIYLVPKPHNFLIGEWDLTTLGTDTPTMSTSHPNPWNYLTRVPIVFWGPGYVEAGVDESVVDIADIAPSFADVLGMDTSPYQGESLLEPAGKRPKVIFTVIIDGGGWNALQYHSDSWPNIKRLMDTGLTFVNGTIGSAPSITGALHATMGTGVYPETHGIPGNQMRGADGKNTDTWLQNADPRYLKVPTMSELWDEQNGNDAIVGTVSYEGWHLGMIGHGAQRDGGDKDIAVLWEAEENAWWVNEDYYELPDYLQTTDLATLEGYEEELDARDGLEDGSWYGKTLEQLQEDLIRPGTPAFVRFTGDAVEEVMREEGFGTDDITDLMWVEMKMPDYAGHAWNMIGPEQEDVIRETDRQIGRFLDTLDELVGKGNYLFALSADHGQQPLPDTYGGWRINNRELQRDIEARFGEVIEKVTPVDIYVDRDALEDSDYTMEDIARYLGTYTIGENIPEGVPGADLVPEGRLDETLFAGAFSTGFLQEMSYEDIAALGDGEYPEGDFTIGD